MKLSVKGLAVAFGMSWGASLLLIGLFNLYFPPYGEGFLQLVTSIYPGYHGEKTLISILTGTGYGLVDGAICGAVVAWLYNLAAGQK